MDLSDDDVTRAVNEIMGFSTDQNRLRAIQSTLDEAGIEIRTNPQPGAVVDGPDNRRKSWWCCDAAIVCRMDPPHGSLFTWEQQVVEALG